MRFLMLAVLWAGLLGHQVLLAYLFSHDPRVFFYMRPWNRALLRLSDAIFAGVTFVGTFMLSIVFGETGIVGLVLGFLTGLLAIADSVWIIKLYRR